MHTCTGMCISSEQKKLSRYTVCTVCEKEVILYLQADLGVLHSTLCKDRDER